MGKGLVEHYKRTEILPLTFFLLGSLSEVGHRGLQCLLQKRLANVEDKFRLVCASYSQALGPNAASLLEDWPQETPECHKELDDSSEDSDFEAV